MLTGEPTVEAGWYRQKFVSNEAFALCTTSDIKKLENYRIVVLIDDSVSMNRSTSAMKVGDRLPETRWDGVKRDAQLVSRMSGFVDGIDFHFLHRNASVLNVSSVDDRLTHQLNKKPTLSTSSASLLDAINSFGKSCLFSLPTICLVFTDRRISHDKQLKKTIQNKSQVMFSFIPYGTDTDAKLFAKYLGKGYKCQTYNTKRIDMIESYGVSCSTSEWVMGCILSPITRKDKKSSEEDCCCVM